LTSQSSGQKRRHLHISRKRQRQNQRYRLAAIIKLPRFSGGAASRPKTEKKARVRDVIPQATNITSSNPYRPAPGENRQYNKTPAQYHPPPSPARLAKRSANDPVELHAAAIATKAVMVAKLLRVSKRGAMRRHGYRRNPPTS
jgi:hypothetical protein